MFSKIEPFLLHSLSSVHAGTGSEVGIVDLPIQREKHTGYPKIESSSLKGALRTTVEDIVRLKGDETLTKKVSYTFGALPKKLQDENDGVTEEDLASAIGLADARLLFFPVKSLSGVFAWVTSPYALNRFARELKLYNSELLKDIRIPQKPGVSSQELFVDDNKIVLEEYTFSMEIDEDIRLFAEHLQNILYDSSEKSFTKRVAVLSDNDFVDFVHLSTEINTRVKINPETGVVDKDTGALWNEENLPPETILYSFLFASDVRVKDKGTFSTAEHVVDFVKDPNILPEVFQLGGNSTLGRGMLRLIWAGEE